MEKNLLKNLLFFIPLVVIATLLSMLKTTGMTAHIAISVIGLVLLVVYALTTKKTWKCPALEVLHRVFYAVALITGVVIMNVSGIAAVTLVHRISATLFTVLFAVTEVYKIIKK